MNNTEWIEISLKESYDQYRDLISWWAIFHKGKDSEQERLSKGVLEHLKLKPGWQHLPLMRYLNTKYGD